MAPFTTVVLLMRSSTAMNSSGLSPILTSNSLKLLLPPPLLLLSSRACSQPSSLPLLVLPSTVASPSPSLWVLCQKLSPGRRTPEPYCPVYPVSSLPSVSGRTSRLLLLSPSWTLVVLPRTHLLLFSWSLRLKPSPTVSVLGWVVWCPSTFLRHAHPLSSSIAALSGPSSTLSISFPPAYTRSVAFLSTWLPPLQPSPTCVAALHLPLSPCLFSSCTLLFPLLPVLSPPLPPLSWSSSGAHVTCCSFSVSSSLKFAAPSSTLPDFLWWASRCYPWSPHLSSRPFHPQFYPVPSWISSFCHHLRQTFGTVLPPYSSVLCPQPSCLPSSSSSSHTGALSRWVVAPLCL